MTRNLKPRSKRQIDNFIAEAVGKDEEALKGLHRMMYALVRYCGEHDIEPESALVEIAFFREVAMDSLKRKHIATISEDTPYPFSPDKAAAIEEDYRMLMEGIERTSMARLAKMQARQREQEEAKQDAEAPQAPAKATVRDERPIYIN